MERPIRCMFIMIQISPSKQSRVQSRTIHICGDFGVKSASSTPVLTDEDETAATRQIQTTAAVDAHRVKHLGQAWSTGLGCASPNVLRIERHTQNHTADAAQHMSRFHRERGPNLAAPCPTHACLQESAITDDACDDDAMLSRCY